MVEGLQTPSSVVADESGEVSLQAFITALSPGEVGLMYEVLEKPNWAPWLAARAEILAARARVFQAGQLVMKNAFGEMMASLSMNQIDWDGNPQSLPTWDEVAGDPTDYSKTYVPDGNTLVLMSMNVANDHKGQRLPSAMVDAAAELAQQLGVEHLIGSFRPSGYGEAKIGMGWDLDFWEYCLMKRAGSEKPVDPWLGSLWHKGMKMIAEDQQAMVVPVKFDEFEFYKLTYRPELWVEVKQGIWECGEVGSWKVNPDPGLAVYQESNVWGSLAFR